MNILKISIYIIIIGFSVNSFATQTYTQNCTKSKGIMKLGGGSIQCQKTFRIRRLSHTKIHLFCSSSYPCPFNATKHPKSKLYCKGIGLIGPPLHITVRCSNYSRHTYHPLYTFTCNKKKAGNCFFSPHIATGGGPHGGP